METSITFTPIDYMCFLQSRTKLQDFTRTTQSRTRLQDFTRTTFSAQ
jgi:hypothetical protein